MPQAKDHTGEVEKRVTAIRIEAGDSCGFFEVREMALAPLQECWFCRYGQFATEDIRANAPGYCKYKMESGR